MNLIHADYVTVSRDVVSDGYKKFGSRFPKGATLFVLDRLDGWMILIPIRWHRRGET